jgi:hypothetical protein
MLLEPNKLPPLSLILDSLATLQKIHWSSRVIYSGQMAASLPQWKSGSSRLRHRLRKVATCGGEGDAPWASHDSTAHKKGPTHTQYNKGPKITVQVVIGHRGMGKKMRDGDVMSEHANVACWYMLFKCKQQSNAHKQVKMSHMVHDTICISFALDLTVLASMTLSSARYKASKSLLSGWMEGFDSVYLGMPPVVQNAVIISDIQGLNNI